MQEIKGYEGLYSVTEDGKIWASAKLNWKSRFLKTWLIGHGYQVVALYKEEKQKKFLVHRLVALTYIPNPLNFKEVNHKNANRLDNRVENLEWVSSKQNKRHAINLGLYKNLGKNSPKGSENKQSKLTECKVIKLRNLYRTGKFTQEQLAVRFKVADSTIGHIIGRRSWKHV